MFFHSRILATAVGLALAPVATPGFETSARAAYVLDQATGTVLLAKNAEEPLPPASMSKLMTLYVVFEALRDGRLDLDEKLPVSEHAMSYRGSTMFLDTSDRVRVEDLLRGIIVLSGNDACVVLAEALSPDGTEAGFARYMTRRARKLGMNNSSFVNASGWPHDNHVMSAHDLAIIALRLIEDFPEYYPLFSETEFAFDGRAPSNRLNRNPLLKLGIGADGLKTGHTEAAGYGLTGSAKRGDQRIIFVLAGMETTRQRAEEAEAVVNWAFRQFALRTLAKAGQPIAEAKVWMGRKPEVTLTAAQDLTMLLPVLADKPAETEVVYFGPIEAPVAKGEEVAFLVVRPERLPEARLPLVAAEDVRSGGLLSRINVAIGVLMRPFREAVLRPDAS